MSVSAIDADDPKTEAEAQLVAEFEASLPFSVKVQIGLMKIWEKAARYVDFCAPTSDRIDKLQTQLMRKRFDERDRSILIPGDVYPLLDPKTGRPVPLVDDVDDVVRVRFWAGLVDERENDIRIGIARGIAAFAGWLRRLAYQRAVRIARSICDALCFAPKEEPCPTT